MVKATPNWPLKLRKESILSEGLCLRHGKFTDIIELQKYDVNPLF